MDALPQELLVGLGATKATPVSGGDIAKAFYLESPAGPFFLKAQDHPLPGLFTHEARGLSMLRAAAPAEIHIPRVVAASDRGLVLEWIDIGPVSQSVDAAFGRGLAQLHQVTHSHFGASTGTTGYLGSVKVDMTPTASWPEFYFERRLRPLVAQAVMEGKLPHQALVLLEKLDARVAQLCGPTEPPALVHGDLWAGNRLVDSRGENWLVDPAVHFAHRELDLAMMLLFGGFGAAVFDAYHEVYPLADDWKERVPWYQLVPLLVHTILFGGGYSDSVLYILTRLSR